ncbi:unnamed protein product, partial [Ectocarpus sp. 4 AP-2014]
LAAGAPSLPRLELLASLIFDFDKKKSLAGFFPERGISRKLKGVVRRYENFDQSEPDFNIDCWMLIFSASLIYGLFNTLVFLNTRLYSMSFRSPLSRKQTTIDHRSPRDNFHSPMF